MPRPDRDRPRRVASQRQLRAHEPAQMLDFVRPRPGGKDEVGI